MADLAVRRVEVDADPGGWARWEVVDDAGEVVGFVAESRPWIGHGHGPLSFDVACRPEPMPAPACWSSRGHDTVTDALDELTRHRADAHREDDRG